jgi:hypothetical protein
MDESTKPHLPSRGPSPGAGHETTDVNIWAVGKFGIALVIITALSIGMLIGLFKFFQSREAGATTVDPVKMFPSPQLEQSEPTDLKQFREVEEKVLNGYAWVDPQKGLVRIPVNQAIDLLAKKGLPTRQQTPAQAAAVSMPTESGLGQVVHPEEPKK